LRLGPLAPFRRIGDGGVCIVNHAGRDVVAPAESAMPHNLWPPLVLAMATGYLAIPLAIVDVVRPSVRQVSVRVRGSNVL
jgi:hypothetical protein